MIEKLDPLRDNFLTMVKKHNALVNAVNGILDYAPLEMAMKAKPESAENVPGPIKLYVCPDGSVYDNEDVAKSHAAGLPQKEALTMALEALHAIAHWGPWKDDREEYAEKAHKKICELLAKGGDNE